MSLLLLFRPKDVPGGRVPEPQPPRRRVRLPALNEDDDELLLVLAIQHSRVLAS